MGALLLIFSVMKMRLLQTRKTNTITKIVQTVKQSTGMSFF